MREKVRESKIFHTFLLQCVIVIYTLATVAAKYASSYKFLSKEFVFFYGIEIFILGIYALLWQQMIKRFELMVAYANRAAAVFWSLVWAVLFFREAVSWNNILGIIIVFIGIMVVNGEEHE